MLFNSETDLDLVRSVLKISSEVNYSFKFTNIILQKRRIFAVFIEFNSPFTGARIPTDAIALKKNCLFTTT